LPASFSKVWTVLEALRDGCETVIWADADIGFMDMTVDLADLLSPDYWLAGYRQRNSAWIGDRPYLCAGLMVIRNGIPTIKFVEDWVRRIETREVTWHPWEQWHLDAMLRETEFRGVRMCDAAEIGSFSREMWNDGVPWKLGYPTVHLTTPLDWPKRRRIFIDHYQGLVKRTELHNGIPDTASGSSTAVLSEVQKDESE
jgi:hypothetical protein